MTTFGLHAAIGDPPRGEHLPQRIDEVCAEAQLAQQVGFDAILYYWQSNSLSFQEQRSEAEFSIAKMAPDRIILGSPEKVVDQLQQWQGTIGAEMVIFRLRQAHSGGPPQKKILRSIRLFGDKVIPKSR